MTKVYTENWWFERQWQKVLKKEFQAEYPRIVKVLESIDRRQEVPKINIKSGEGIYLYGDLGTGKTITAALIYMDQKKEAYLAGELNSRKMIFTSMPKIINKLKFSFEDKNISTERIIQNLIDADFLVIDEFGLSKPTDWLIDLLYTIVGGRYDKLKSTLYTSNYELSKVAEILEDERITSRISRNSEIIRKKPWGKA